VTTALQRGSVVVRGVLLVSVLLSVASCGDSEPRGVAQAGGRGEDPAALIAETRPATAAERSLDDDGGNGVMACSNVGGVIWDYAAEFGETERGRQPADALRAAIASINESDGDQLPLSGWTELVLDERSRLFVLPTEAGKHLAAIQVGGDPAIPAWRYNKASICETAYT
jgi:hypothetical protein